ncbi:MAG: hypothetical protein V4677_09060 [Bacteroidota bacterium]
MKTLTYLPTLLALTIQVMVSGQTQGNQDRKIRVDIMGLKEPVKMNYSNSNITISMTEYIQLLEEANSLKIESKKLKEEAINIEVRSLLKQIEVSEVSEKISIQKFEQNKILILDLFTKVPKNNITYTKAQAPYSESERFMKIAREMREEANAQLTLQARYGDMSNAEEKEALALDKQKEVLQLFESNYPQLVQTLQKLVVENKKAEQASEMGNQLVMASNTTESLLANALQQAEDIKITAQQLRLNALTSGPNQKMVLTDEAIGLENDYMLKQLEISSLRSKKHHEQFDLNRKTIALLMEQVKDENILSKAEYINSEAERLMKIGKEMREEANAQLTVFAKIGSMSNAEETETFALGKQKESMEVLDKGSLKAVVASR